MTTLFAVFAATWGAWLLRSVVLFIFDYAGRALFTVTGGAQYPVANQNWNEDLTNRLAEVTNAGLKGQAQYIATVNDQSGNFDVVWENTNRPETGGLIAGNTGAIVLEHGTSSHTDSQNIIIEKVTKKSDSKGGTAIMYNVSYKGNGVVTST